MTHGPTAAPDTGWPPRRLTVIYDDHCELCTRCAHWLAVQPAHVEFQFLAASDPAVFDRYGELPWYRIELMVVADNGSAWVGGSAFIMCLWATVRWHQFSYKLSGRSLAPMAERFFHALSANRSVVSNLLTPTRCSDASCGLPREGHRHGSGGHPRPLPPIGVTR